MRLGEYIEGSELLPDCVWCDGGELHKHKYDGLFGVIGYCFGRPTGVTFRVPTIEGSMICYNGEWPTPQQMINSRLNRLCDIHVQHDI
jgi:hypothetical protein